MPLEMEDPEGDDPSDSGRGRFRAPRSPWWRPAGPWGRTFLALAVLIAVSGVAVALYMFKSLLVHDGRFRIAGTGNIQATGLAQVSRAEMLPVFGEDIGRNIFFVPLGQRRSQLEQIPWVQRATVMRLLPDQIRVSVVERQPVAFVRHGQQIGLVDADGVLLSMPAAAMAQHHYSFPVLTGIDGRDPLPSRKARMAVYTRLLGELDADGQHNSDQLSEIDLTDPEDARVLIPEQGADILAHFGEDHFLERYQRYKAHIAEWRQQYPRLASVDLRYDQQVVLEMAKGAAGDQATVPAADVKPAPSAAQATPKPRQASVKSAAKPAQAAAKPAPRHDAAQAAPKLKQASAKPPAKPPAKTQAKTPARPAPATAKSAPRQDAAHSAVHARQASSGMTRKSRPTDSAIEKAAEKQRAARIKAMKRAAANKRAALNRNRQRAAKPRPAAASGQGQ